METPYMPHPMPRHADADQCRHDDELELRRCQLVERRKLLDRKAALRATNAKEFAAVHRKGLVRARDSLGAQLEQARARNEAVRVTTAGALHAATTGGGARTSPRTPAQAALRSAWTSYCSGVSSQVEGWREKRCARAQSALAALETEERERSAQVALAGRALEEELALRSLVERRKRDLEVMRMYERTAANERELRSAALREQALSLARDLRAEELKLNDDARHRVAHETEAARATDLRDARDAVAQAQLAATEAGAAAAPQPPPLGTALAETATAVRSDAAAAAYGTFLSQQQAQQAQQMQQQQAVQQQQLEQLQAAYQQQQAQHVQRMQMAQMQQQMAAAVHVPVPVPMAVAPPPPPQMAQMQQQMEQMAQMQQQMAAMAQMAQQQQPAPPPPPLAAAGYPVASTPQSHHSSARRPHAPEPPVSALTTRSSPAAPPRPPSPPTPPPPTPAEVSAAVAAAGDALPGENVSFAAASPAASAASSAAPSPARRPSPAKQLAVAASPGAAEEDDDFDEALSVAGSSRAGTPRGLVEGTTTRRVEAMERVASEIERHAARIPAGFVNQLYEQNVAEASTGAKADVVAAAMAPSASEAASMGPFVPKVFCAAMLDLAADCAAEVVPEDVLAGAASAGGDVHAAVAEHHDFERGPAAPLWRTLSAHLRALRREGALTSDELAAAFGPALARGWVRAGYGARDLEGAARDLLRGCCAAAEDAAGEFDSSMLGTSGLIDSSLEMSGSMLKMPGSLAASLDDGSVQSQDARSVRTPVPVFGGLSKKPKKKAGWYNTGGMDLGLGGGLGASGGDAEVDEFDEFE